MDSILLDYFQNVGESSPNCLKFPQYNETDFRKRFRMSKSVFESLLNSIIDEIQTDGRGIDPRTRLMVALRFYATGTFQLVCADLIGNANQSTISRIVSSISKILAKKANDTIGFPTEDGAKMSMVKFSRIASFPGVFAAIDCTHVPIQVPNAEKSRFINRKNVTSLNCQAAVDSDMKLINLVARWPGSTHDARIFNNSLLKLNCQTKEWNGHLIGDSAYALSQYMMTPLSTNDCQMSASERNYQKAHRKTRQIIERFFGLFKRKFPCLKGLRNNLSNSMNIIVACGFLWNFLLMHGEICVVNNDDEDDDDDVEEYDDGNSNDRPRQESEINNSETIAGRALRTSIISRF